MDGGWYWVRWITDSRWEVAERDADGTWWCGREIAIHDPEVVGKRIKRPEEGE